MSRSNPTPTNPSTKFFKWSGSTGKLVWYDKEAEQEKEIKLPFSFLVLDQLATIAGFNEQDNSSYWSNEVRSVAKDELTVRTSAGTKAVGLYKDLADVRGKGAKYAKSIYIAFEDGGEIAIGNIKAYGAALTSWIEFTKSHDVLKGKVVLTGSETAKKGTTTYHVPTFEKAASTPEEDEKAVELDKELQSYLSLYLSAAQFDRASQQDEGSVEDLNDIFPE